MVVATTRDAEDRRRLFVAATSAGKDAFDAARAKALAISAETLAPLSAAEQATFLTLLTRLT